MSKNCSVKRDISVTRDISSSREREMLTQGFDDSSKDSLGSEGRSRYDRFKFRNERPATDRYKSNEDQKSRSRSNSKSSCERPSSDRKKSRKHQRSTSHSISTSSSTSTRKNRRKRRKWVIYYEFGIILITNNYKLIKILSVLFYLIKFQH